MRYELAKELKDAGFAQYAGDNYIFPTGAIVSGMWEGPADTACRVPTLEELIEACGDGFGYLMAIHETGHFQAGGGSVVVDLDGTPNRGTYDTRISGSTPSEAVARLWLALNKK